MIFGHILKLANDYCIVLVLESVNYLSHNIVCFCFGAVVTNYHTFGGFKQKKLT